MKKIKLVVLSVVVSLAMIMSAYVFEVSQEIGAFLYILGIIALFYSCVPLLLGKTESHKKTRREYKINRR